MHFSSRGELGTYQTAASSARAGGLAMAAGRGRSPWPRCRAPEQPNQAIRGDRAKYYILIDLISGSRWNLQRYLT